MKGRSAFSLFSLSLLYPIEVSRASVSLLDFIV